MIMKQLLVVIFILVCALVNQSNAEERHAIYSTKTEDVIMEVVQVPGFNYWTRRTGKEELSLRFESSKAIQVNYGLCGLLCGALIEGMATRPSDKVLKLATHGERWVRFVDQKKSVEVHIDAMRITLSHSEAKRLVDVLLKYWYDK